MTNEQILKKAIEKAVENGWSEELSKTTLEILPEVFSYGEGGARDMFIRGFVFSHDFAKAFFGTQKYSPKEVKQVDELPGSENWYKIYDSMDSYVGCVFLGEIWQYHIQQMAIFPDPIKYLEQFL